MPSLLIIVFVFQLALHLINTVGALIINDILWALFTRLYSTVGNSGASQVKLKIEIIRLKRELQSTSSQDEFAKWAKLRRQHDKAVAEYEQQSGSIQSFRSRFDKLVTAARWLGTNGLRALLQFWYQKEPMFWMPKRWVPLYIEWILSFPRAPIGSVSVQMWTISCGTVINLIGAALVAAWVLIPASKGKQRQEVNVNAGSAAGTGICRRLAHESEP